MTFLKNLFGRNKGKGQEAAPATPAPVAPPAPAQEPATAPAPVAPPAPEPVIDTAASDAIRQKLDEIVYALNSVGVDDPNFQTKSAIALNLTSLRSLIGDAPCAFADYDTAIVDAIEQFESLCQTCDLETVEDFAAKLGDAIRGRSNTPESTRNYEPTMRRLRYLMLLTTLQGRLNAVNFCIAENANMAAKGAMSEADQKLFQAEAIQLGAGAKALAMQVATVRNALAMVEHQIATGAAATAVNLGAEEAINAAAWARSFQGLMADVLQNRTKADARLAHLFEEIKMMLIRATAAERQHKKEMDAITAMSSDFGDLLGGLDIPGFQMPGVEIPQAPVQQEQPAAATQEPETIMPATANVFSDEFAAKPAAM